MHSRDNRIFRRRVCVAAALSAACAATLGPASALASTAGVSGGVLTYAGAAGEQNGVNVFPRNGYVIVSDSAGIGPSAGCASADSTTVYCAPTGVTSLALDGGDQDDTLSVFHWLPAVLDGGLGNDTLAGGAGPDSLIGGAGIDSAEYWLRTVPVNVTLDGTANDGAAGEGDNVSTEAVRGGSGGDRLTGGGDANQLYGGPGDDILDGGAGVDDLRGDSGADLLTTRDAVADNAACGTEADVLTADLVDVAGGDCETVNRAAYDSGSGGGTDPAPDPGTDPAPDPGTGTTPEPGTDPAPDPGTGGTDPAPDPGTGTTPGLDPVPPTTGFPAPALVIKNTVITVSTNYIVSVRVSCPATAKRNCKGRIVLEIELPGAASSVVHVSRRARPKKVKVGTRRFALRPGGTKVFGVKIARHGRKALDSRGRVPARVSLNGTEAGRPTTTTRRVTLVKAARKSRPTRLNGSRRR